ncbi:hypothetical protein ACH492_22155 [Streptomyces sp. NPDC019443]|uniref:hypothetical protein n=1 Tax=Streptomyces sp. NPDC019443 TaxID=3365061 RepID=UPI0037ACE6CC
MPKITRHGGASNAHAPETAGAAESTPAEAAPAPDRVLHFDKELSEEEYAALKKQVEGGDQPSAGTSSSPSSEKPPTSTEPSETAAPKRAPRTASRSKKGQTGSSSARSTDGEKTDASPDN